MPLEENRLSKNIFTLLFLMISVVILWIGGGFFYELNQYFQLSAKAPVILDEWSINEKESGKFTVSVRYTFEWKGQTIYGLYDFQNPTYQNPYLANDHIDVWKKKSWIVWLNPNKPTVVSLQKAFPTKKGVHLSLCLAVLFYFGFLKGYVRRMNAS